MKILKNRLNSIGRSLLIAIAIGDGCISKKGQILINHSWKQRGYCYWLHSLLKHNGIKVGKMQRYVGSNGYLSKTIQYRFCISTYSFNQVLRRCMYNGSQKKISRKLLNRLSQQGLAIWFMDDGTILRRKYNGKYKGFYLRIATYCSAEQADIIIKYFNEEWNIYPTKVCEHKIGDKYTINFGAKEGRKFIDIIKPYMCPSLMYKVLWNLNDLEEYYGTQDTSEILVDSTLESDRLLMEAHTTR